MILIKGVGRVDLLEEYRYEIDRIDKQMTNLFEERMNIVKKVSKYKLGKNMEIYQKDREEKVINKNIEYLSDKEYSSLLSSYYINLMSLSRLVQNKESFKYQENMEKSIKEQEQLIIGYQGVVGSFSEEAMFKYFKKVNESKNYDKFEDLFVALNEDKVDYIIVPIENSSTGGITKIYELLNKYNFYIVGEECIKINQNLIGIKGAKIDEIEEVYSHPQGFEQSNETLKKYNNLKLIPHLNTAISAKLVSDLNDKTKAAIASDKAARIYNLEIIKGNINDVEDNYTKFVIIGKSLEVNSQSNKSSIIFSIEDEAGSLHKILNNFTSSNINLMKIESRPNKHIPWKYLFYIDFEGSIDDINVKNTLKVVELESKYFKFLGSYKKYNI
ncbi:MAG: chorismate mutase [Peptostreptococcaceae bacterium]